MNKIGGNSLLQLQKRTATSNDIGEHIEVWETAQTFTGWLDLSGGDSKYQTYNSKIQESTHIFLADYKELAEGVKTENSRALISGKVYDIMLIDNPMEMNMHLEFYLKFTGGQ